MEEPGTQPSDGLQPPKPVKPTDDSAMLRKPVVAVTGRALCPYMLVPSNMKPRHWTGQDTHILKLLRRACIHRQVISRDIWYILGTWVVLWEDEIHYGFMATVSYELVYVYNIMSVALFNDDAHVTQIRSWVSLCLQCEPTVKAPEFHKYRFRELEKFQSLDAAACEELTNALIAALNIPLSDATWVHQLCNTVFTAYTAAQNVMTKHAWPLLNGCMTNTPRGSLVPAREEERNKLAHAERICISIPATIVSIDNRRVNLAFRFLFLFAYKLRPELKLHFIPEEGVFILNMKVLSQSVGNPDVFNILIKDEWEDLTSCMEARLRMKKREMPAGYPPLNGENEFKALFWRGFIPLRNYLLPLVTCEELSSNTLNPGTYTSACAIAVSTYLFAVKNGTSVMKMYMSADNIDFECPTPIVSFLNRASHSATKNGG